MLRLRLFLFCRGGRILGPRRGSLPGDRGALKVDAVEHLVGRVVCAHDLDVDDGTPGEPDGLP